jgi:hypothetical protein
MAQGVWGSSATDIFAVGYGGTILHYDGTEWSAMSSGTTQSLLGVWGNSATDVFAVGYGGTILHYDGTDWSAMSSGTTQRLEGVWGSSATDVFAVGGGTILHYDGTDWSNMSSGTTQTLQGVWGKSATDVFAVGGGPILHYDGTGWRAISKNPPRSLLNVWGSSATDVFAVGGSGTTLHYDGTDWSNMSSGTMQTLYGVWGSSATDVFAVGGDPILHYDGTGWSAISISPPRILLRVWGSSATDIFGLGYSGSIFHYNGTEWSAMTSGTWQRLRGVWGSSSTDVFAVGDGGTILHYDGTGWSAMSSGTTQKLEGVWGSSSKNVFAVGDAGAILHYDGTKWSNMSSGTTLTLYGVWGSSATDVFVVGFLGIIFHFDGTGWSAMSSGTNWHLYGVWGNSATDVFALGDGGTILHFDGTDWTAMSSGTTLTLYGVWGSSATDVFAVGYGGTILHYSPAATSPTVTTEAASAITSNSVTLNMSFTTGSYGSVDIRFAHRKSSDSAWTYTDWTTKSTAGDHAEAIAGLDSDTPYDFKAQLTYKSTVLSGDTLQFTTSGVALPPAIGLSRNNLSFGYEIGGPPPSAQKVLITNIGGGTLDWTAEAKSWIRVAPASGIGDGRIAVSVDAVSLAAGTYSSQVKIEAAGAANSPQTIDVTLNVIASGASVPPFGHFDTPADGAMVCGAVPVTGWALDDVEVVSVEIKRSPHASDHPSAIGLDGLVTIGDAIFVEGARPDIEAAFPDYPMNYRAGWGYMLHPKMLLAGIDGPFTLHAFAVDNSGNRTKLGEKSITGDFAKSELPFGTIDTPEPGDVISGASDRYFGWALTPPPNMIPEDGSTITVWVDGANFSRPIYNHDREDIGTLFPGYANSSRAGGLYSLDTTDLANGVHTIAWGVVDNAGNAAGIGLRYFTVLNLGAKDRVADESMSRPFEDRWELSEIATVPTAYREPVYVSKGYDMAHALEMVQAGADGTVNIRIQEVERVELVIGIEAMERAVRSGRFSGRGSGARPPAWARMQPDQSFSGYLVVGDELRPLPIGSTLDSRSGVFAWQPGPGFLGEYTFVFVRVRQGGLQDKSVVRITIEPKF